MISKKKAIFAGTSNTMGLGLELETSERYQDDYFLTNICKNIPPTQHYETNLDSYTDEDVENHRKYRWSKLVCDYFDFEEINVNDPIDENQFDFFDKSRQAVDTVFSLYDKRNDDNIKQLLSETKCIFLEFGYIRWWEHDLHGTQSDYKWPSTPVEIENFLNDKNVSIADKQKAIDWLNELNPMELWKRTLSKIKQMVDEFPDIQFVLLCWGLNLDAFNLKITKQMMHTFLEVPVKDNYDFLKYDIPFFLEENKLQIKNTVKAYNPKYKDKWLYEDAHANVKGHEIIANQIIKKLQNETRDLYSI